MNGLRFTAVSALKDLRRLLRDPLGLAMCIVMPFIITLLVSIVFGGDGPTPRGTLLVVDNDDTFLSSAVRSAFGQGPLSKMISVETVTAEEGRKRIDRGDGSGLFTIPAGFQQKFLKDEPCELQLLTNPAQRILPGIIKEALLLLADAGMYAQAFFGDEMRKYADRPPTEAEVAAMSIKGRLMGEQWKRYIDPLVIEVETPKATEETKLPPLGVLFFPGMLFFGVILVGQTLSQDIWKEKSAGTLRRTLTTSGSSWAFLLGKTISVAAVLAAVGALGLACAVGLLHQAIPMPFLALVWVVVAGIPIYLVFVLVNLVASSERGANVLTSIVVFVLALVGGGMFPFDMMPQWLVDIGQWTPNGWASTQFKAILAGKVGEGMPRALIGLAATGLIAYALSNRLLRKFAPS